MTPSPNALLRNLATATLEESERRDRDPIARVLIVSPGYRVLADAVAGPAARGHVPHGGDQWQSRPEIRAALRGEWVHSRRFSSELGRTIELTAGPVPRGDRPPLALRLSAADASSRGAAAARRTLRNTAEVGAGVIAFGLLAAALLARQLTRPLRALEEVARRDRRREPLARGACRWRA
jgi:hypothetical protein